MSNPIAHTVAASATVGSVAGLVFNALPPILAGLASLAAVVWYALQVWESRTVQEWFARRHPRARKLKKLRREQREEPPERH